MLRPVLVQWLSPIAVLLATAITVYKFWIQRPSLILDAELTPLETSGERIAVEIELYVANVGRDFAEDGYVEFDLDGWSFDEPPTPAADGDVVGVSDEGDRTAHGAWADGGRYKLFFDSIVYQRTGFQLYTATATLPADSSRGIEYVTACQSQKPTAGRLEIRVAESGKSASIVRP